MELAVQRAEAGNRRLLEKTEEERRTDHSEGRQEHNEEVESLRKELDKRKRTIEDLKMKMNAHECDIGGYLVGDFKLPYQPKKKTALNGNIFNSCDENLGFIYSEISY